MKNLLLLIVGVLCFHFGNAQEQAAVFSQYHLSPILLTPAVAGFNDVHQIQMNVRSQWTGFPGSPKTYSVGYNGGIGKTLGVGVGLLSENIGNQSRVRLQLNYAFRYRLRDVKMALGFSTEFHTIKLADSVKENAFYEEGDLRIDEAIEGDRIFDAALGFWGTYKDATHIGLTFPNLVVARIGDIQSGDPQGSLFKFVIFNIGHEFDVDEYNFKLEPSLMIRRVKDVPFQVDFNLVGAFLDEKLVAGLSYRTGIGGEIGILLGTRIDSFKLYYSYGLSFQRFQQYSSGTHEVMVAFDFAKGKKKFDHGN